MPRSAPLGWNDVSHGDDSGQSDFTSEADMVRKLRIGLALQPIVTALFANSPFLDGKPSGALSQRSRIWLDTDPNRTGMLLSPLKREWASNAMSLRAGLPMYFVKRGEIYHDVAGELPRLLDGRLRQLPRARDNLDWQPSVYDLSGSAPEDYLECARRRWTTRSYNRAPRTLAGLFYDSEALDGAYELTKD